MTGPAGEPVSLLSRAYRPITAGVVLVITLIAFESMAVATAMPTAVRELHGLRYYSWPFTAFMVASVLAVVLAGEQADRRGPRPVLLVGFGVFCAGLVGAGVTGQMAVFVAARAVQGLGVGLLVVPLFVVIAEVFDDATRPRVFAVVSAAWVLPALIGPIVAGLVTQHLTWRLAFLGLVPLVLVGAVLVLRALRRHTTLGSSDPVGSERRVGVAGRGSRAPYALLVAVGLVAVQYAGQPGHRSAPVLALPGLVTLWWAARRILPAGTVRLRSGLPATVGYRGLLSGAFFGVEAFMPLTLTQLHGYSPTAAGVPLTVGALGWSAGSWFQGRRPHAPRHALVRAGCALIGAGATGLVSIAFAGSPGWLAVPAWAISGTGMGLAVPSVSVLLMRLSPAAERGSHSAALQISDMLASAVTIGLGGVLLARIVPLPAAITTVDLTMAAIAGLGVLFAGRLRAPAGHSAAGER